MRVGDVGGEAMLRKQTAMGCTRGMKGGTESSRAGGMLSERMGVLLPRLLGSLLAALMEAINRIGMSTC